LREMVANRLRAAPGEPMLLRRNSCLTNRGASG